MLNVTCRDLDEITKEILEPIVHDFQTRYPRVEGEAYLGYPIYFNRVTNEKTSVDMALITKIGVFIFNVLKNTVPNYDEIQNDIYYRVKEKFQRLPHLRNGKKLKFEFLSIPGDSEPPFRRRSTAVPFLVIPRFRESDTVVPVR